ncbi:hypothetical protein [Oceanivirga miroungae]|uniref:Uncharacterized protein n=1 Tax=Oceanivirga miroungae TaxID=1130046 RepID=A0A6I8M776_9FUSO|nr:hypothetical protein [Oceanivirga miroungae]VWL85266.1 hypothetical protein OMES3154_00549 [Oceanivirga miroungae]
MISNSILIRILKDTIVITETLEKNINKLKKNKNISDIYFIKQIENLEDELIYCTNIKQIKELLNSKSNSNFKKDFINCSNILEKLESKKFSINKLWIREENIFNSSSKIKIK